MATGVIVSWTSAATGRVGLVDLEDAAGPARRRRRRRGRRTRTPWRRRRSPPSSSSELISWTVCPASGPCELAPVGGALADLGGVGRVRDDPVLAPELHAKEVPRELVARRPRRARRGGPARPAPRSPRSSSEGAMRAADLGRARRRPARGRAPPPRAVITQKIGEPGQRRARSRCRRRSEGRGAAASSAQAEPKGSRNSLSVRRKPCLNVVQWTGPPAICAS